MGILLYLQNCVDLRVRDLVSRDLRWRTRGRPDSIAPGRDDLALCVQDRGPDRDRAVDIGFPRPGK